MVDGEQSDDVVARALVHALVLCVRYLDERDVPDDIADDDCKVLESVAACLLDVPETARPRLVGLVGPYLAAATGLIEEDEKQQGRAAARTQTGVLRQSHR